jgi:hypothetical protein
VVRDGKVTLTWKKVEGAAGYNVYRGTGTLPWKVKYARVTAKPVKAARFTDPTPPPAGGKKMAFYFVKPVAANGSEGPASFKVRTQPPLVEDLLVSVLPDGTAQLAWKKSPAGDVVGYHVYASTVRPATRMYTNCIEQFAGWKRLTKQPLKELKFVDGRKLEKTEGIFAREIRGYQVRAVNSLGVESGPSEIGFTLCSAVPGVRAVQNADGSATVSWDQVREKGVRGYAVYRLDEIRLNACVRLNPHPVKGTSFTDRPETPRSERRRYYVVAVDALGQEGMPSSGAWAFGRP